MSKLGSSIATASFIRIIGQLITWGFSLAIVRFLKPWDYGIIAIAMATYGLFVSVLDWTAQQLLIRARDCSVEYEREISGITAWGAVCAILILVLASAITFAVYKSADLAVALLGISPFLILNVIKVVPESRAARNGLVGRQSFAILLEAIINVTTAWILVHFFADFRALLIGAFCGLLLRTCVLLNSTGGVLPEFRFSSLAPHKKEFFSVGSGEVVPQMTSIAPVYLMGLTLGKANLGFVTTAQHLVSMPASRIMVILNQVLLPHFSKLNETSESVDLRNAVTKAAVNLVWLTLPMFIGMALVSHDLVLVVFGKNWLGMQWLLAVLAVVMPIKMIRDFLINPLRAMRLDRMVLEINLIAFCLTILAVSAGFFVAFDIFAVLLASAIGLASIFGIYKSIQSLKLPLADFVAVIKPVLSTLLMAFVCVALMQRLASSEPLIRLVVVSLSGAMTILVCAVVNFRASLLSLLRARFG